MRAAAQTVARQIRCALFAELHFLSSIERVWSGYGPLAWNGSNRLGLARRMDQPTILEGTDTSTISIAVENRLSDLQRRIERRITDRDQRLEYPADTGFAYIAWTKDWNGAWGTTTK